MSRASARASSLRLLAAALAASTLLGCSRPEQATLVSEPGAATPTPTPEITTPPPTASPASSPAPTGQPSPAPTESADPSPASVPATIETSTVAESDGIRLTLTLRRPQNYASGQRIDIRLRIQNVGEQTVRSEGSPSDDPCWEAAWFQAYPRALTARGRKWPEKWGAFKSATLDRRDPSFGVFDDRTEEHRKAGTWGCAAPGRLPAEWPPGTDLTIHRFWNGQVEGADGRPVRLPPSLLRVKATFHAVELEGSEHDDPNEWKPRNVVVDSDMQVEVGPDQVVGVGEAVDAVLEDDRFRAWMTKRMKEEVPQGRIVVDFPDPYYPDAPVDRPFWRLEATHWLDEDHYDVIWVDVDLVDGKILQVTKRDKEREA